MDEICNYEGLGTNIVDIYLLKTFQGKVLQWQALPFNKDIKAGANDI